MLNGNDTKNYVSQLFQGLVDVRDRMRNQKELSWHIQYGRERHRCYVSDTTKRDLVFAGVQPSGELPPSVRGQLPCIIDIDHR